MVHNMAPSATELSVLILTLTINLPNGVAGRGVDWQAGKKVTTETDTLLP